MSDAPMSNHSAPQNPTADSATPMDDHDFLDLLTPVASHWRSLLVAPILVGAMTYGATYLVRPTFISTATFLPPQQQQSSAASALASLGALTGLGGGAGALKSPADQYVALMESTTVRNRIIDAFKLREAYDVRYYEQARSALAKRVHVTAGKKDGLISVEAEDWDPKRAAAMANQYVEELRHMTSTIAVSEAQQRRVFFEHQLEATKAKLAAAQSALQDTGVNGGALKTEPRSAVEAFARLDAQLTVAQIKLQTLRNALTDGAFEVRQQVALVQALEEQKRVLEQAAQISPGGDAAAGSSDYVTRYREFKYQETLFELFARQYELARSDESREGALIQVIDAAQPAERKSKPQRALITLAVTAAAGLLYVLGLMIRGRWRASLTNPDKLRRVERFRAALRRS